MVLKHERKTPGHAVVFLLVMLVSVTESRKRFQFLATLPRRVIRRLRG
jgi:hypothetical protein